MRSESKKISEYWGYGSVEYVDTAEHTEGNKGKENTAKSVKIRD